MPTASLATGLIALLVLTVPAAAQADAIKHRGTVTGVPGAKVKFAVKKDGRELKAIRNMAFIDVPVTCDDGFTGAISGFLPTFPVAGDDFLRKGKIEGAGIEDGFLRVAGEFSKRGKRASGQVRFVFKSTKSGARCGTRKVDWKTQKK